MTRYCGTFKNPNDLEGQSQSLPFFNRVLEGPKIHIWCKFGDPGSKAWRVIALTSPFLADFDCYDPKWPWRSRSINTIFNRVLEGPTIHIWYKFSDSSSIPRRVIARTSPFFYDLDCFSPKWPWRSRSINTIFNRVLEGPMIHIWCKFGDPRLKTRRVIVRTRTQYHL